MSEFRPRRPRSIQACTSCRKGKVRCEIIQLADLEQPVKCHRCSVVGNDCSFSQLDKALFSKFVTIPPVALNRNSRIQPKEHTVSPPSAGFGIAPENLKEIVSPQINFWRYLSILGLSHRLDWTTPLLTINDVLRTQIPAGSEDTTLTMPVDNSLEDILSQSQVNELLSIFDLHYVPWLSFSLIRDSGGTLLDIICCSVASRHIDPTLRSGIAPRLQRLAEDKITRLIFNPPSLGSLESIQSLLIMALWCPLDAGQSARDGRVLIASAVSMATTLRLHEASARLLQIGATSDSEPTDLINMARLWLALANMESMLCLGSRRTPLAARSSSDIEFIPLSTRSPSTLIQCRDSRLRHMAEIFDATETAEATRLLDAAGLESWYDALMKQLGFLDRARRLLLPLQVVCDHDQFHFQMLLVLLHCCRLRVLHHSILSARLVYDYPPRNPFWFLEVKPYNIGAVVAWGREMHALGETTLVTVLQTDASLLSSCPDIFFTMIAFAAGIVIGFRYMTQQARKGLHGPTDRLIIKTMHHIAAASTSADHPAQNCARFLKAVVSTWGDTNQNFVLATRPPLDSVTSQTNTTIDIDVELELWAHIFGFNVSEKNDANTSNTV